MNNSKKQYAMANAAVDSGVASAAKQFSVSQATVRRAMKKKRIKLPAGYQTFSVRTFVVLRKLLGGARQAQVAREENITRARVGKIAETARAAGFDI